MANWTYTENSEKKNIAISLREGTLILRIGTYANLTNVEVNQVLDSGVGVVLKEGIVSPAKPAGTSTFSSGTIVPPFVASTVYKENQAITHEEKIYISKKEFESGETFKEENWILISGSGGGVSEKKVEEIAETKVKVKEVSLGELSAAPEFNLAENTRLFRGTLKEAETEIKFKNSPSSPYSTEVGAVLKQGTGGGKKFKFKGLEWVGGPEPSWETAEGKEAIINLIIFEEGKKIWGFASEPGVPTGGTTGQVLAKSNNENYKTKWLSISEGSLTYKQLAAAQPYPVDLPENHESKGDGKLLTDASIESGSKVIKSASKPFTAGDVGKYIAICSAGGTAKVEEKAPVSREQFNTRCSRISVFKNSEEIEIESAAAHTVSGALAVYASDDTVPIQEAINNVVEKAKEGAGYGEVWFNHKIYGVAGELKTGGITEGNAQITLPVITSTSEGTASQGQKITLVLRGSSEASELPQWYQKVPQQAGSLLFSFGPRAAGETKLASEHAQPEYSATNGRPSMIGGPSKEKGYEGLKFSNMMLVVSGLTISAPSNGTMTGIELNGVSNANIVSLGSYALGIPSLVGEEYSGGINEFVQPWAGYEKEFAVHKRPAVALAMPGQGNNDNSFVTQHSVEGHTCGIEIGEHGWHSAMRSIYCLFAITPTPGHFLHTSIVGYISVEACAFGIYTPAGGEFNLIILEYDSENQSGRWGKSYDLYDPENKMSGEITMFLVLPPPKVSGGKRVTIKCNAGTTFSNYYTKGSVVTMGGSNPSVPASKEIVANTFWRDAQVAIKSTEKAIKVTVDAITEFTGNTENASKEVKNVLLPSPNTANNNLGALVSGALLQGTNVEGLEVESYNSGTKILTLKSAATGTGTKISIKAIAPAQVEVPANGSMFVPIGPGVKYALQYEGTAPTWNWILK